MLPPGGPWSFNNIRLAGRDVGASMIRDGGSGGSGESPGSCSINIYINNDIKGINNSVLFGSDVTLGDCGVRLSLEEVKMDRGFRVLGKKEMDSFTHCLLLVAFIMMFISIFAYLIIGF